MKGTLQWWLVMKEPRLRHASYLRTVISFEYAATAREAIESAERLDGFNGDTKLYLKTKAEPLVANRAYFI